MRKFTEAERAEVWDRWQAGEAMRSIARRLGRESSSVRTMIEDTGGVRPAGRRRASRCLSLTEREEISRGVAAGDSLRQIAGRLGRAPSTVCVGPATGDDAGIGHIGLIVPLSEELDDRRCASWWPTLNSSGW